MKMFGTERWFVISWSASWIAEPSSVAYISTNRHHKFHRERLLTNLVELDDVWLDAHLAQRGLGGLAVWAVALGEDGDGIVVDDALCLGLC